MRIPVEIPSGFIFFCTKKDAKSYEPRRWKGRKAEQMLEIQSGFRFLYVNWQLEIDTFNSCGLGGRVDFHQELTT